MSRLLLTLDPVNQWFPRFISDARKYGGFQYEPSHEKLKPYTLIDLANEVYREKEVDAKVSSKLFGCVAKYKNDEYYAVATGDRDLLPTLKSEYPDFTQNVMLISTSPNQVGGISSYELVNYVNNNFRLKPLFLDEHVTKFLHIDK